MTRQQAITVLKMVEAYGLADKAKRMAIDALEQPERKTGRWMVADIPDLTSTAQDIFTFTRICRCSECGAMFGRESDNYCYNCGAIMNIERR